MPCTGIRFQVVEDHEFQRRVVAQHEFEAWLEPRADLTTGTVRSMEAVPRWRHAVRGVLLPDDFMPSVRARGLNDDFGWLMVQKAAAECRRLQQLGHELTVCVSLAFDNLADPSIAARVQHVAVRPEAFPGQGARIADA